MTEQINILNGFTGVPDILIWKYNDLLLAAVFGKIQRYCLMRSGKCYATPETIADELCIARQTVISRIEILEAEGYVIDLTPDRRNKPHVRITTDKINAEYEELREYVNKHREEQVDDEEQKDSFFIVFQKMMHEFFSIYFECLKTLLPYMKNSTVQELDSSVYLLDSSVQELDSECLAVRHEDTIKDTTQDTSIKSKESESNSISITIPDESNRPNGRVFDASLENQLSIIHTPDLEEPLQVSPLEVIDSGQALQASPVDESNSAEACKASNMGSDEIIQYYYSILFNTKSPKYGINLESMFSSLFGVDFNRKNISMFNRLVKKYGAKPVYQAIIEIHKMQIDISGGVYGFLEKILKSKATENQRNTKQKQKEDADRLSNQISEQDAKLEALRKEKPVIPVLFGEDNE